MLVSERVDFLVEDESVIRYWGHKLNIRDSIEFSGVDSETEFYPGYKNDPVSAILASKIQAIRTVKSNKPFMKQLLKKYDIANWK